MAHPHQEFPGVSPRTVVKIFHKLEWHIYYLLYSRFGKYREEEDWIFNTQKLADAMEKEIGKVSVWTGSSAFFYHVFTNKCLLSCPSPSPKCRRLKLFTCLVWFGQVFNSTTQSPHATKSLWYPGYIRMHLSQQVPWSILSLTTFSGIFRSRGYAFAG